MRILISDSGASMFYNGGELESIHKSGTMENRQYESR